MRPQPTNSRGGFTLIELLVVIGIIALLISILLPTLNRARQSANALYCLSNERQIGTLINLYANRFDGRLPIFTWRFRPTNGTTVLTSPATVDGETYFGTLIRGMLGESDFTAGSNTDNESATIFNDVDISTVDNANRKQGILHYSTHPRLMPDHNLRDPAFTALSGASVPRTPYKLSQIRDSAGKIALFDGTQQVDALTGNAQSDGYNLDFNRINYDTFLLETVLDGPGLPAGITGDSSIDGGENVDFFVGSTAPRAPGNIRWRHRGNTVANVLYADGHAEAKTYRSRYDTEITRREVCVAPNR